MINTVKPEAERKNLKQLQRIGQSFLCLQQDPTYKQHFLPFKNKGGLFPEPFLEIFFTWLELLDNNYRTAEAHGTGTIKKWSLSMLPIFESKDFKLLGHWNIASSMARGLRETLIQNHNQPLNIDSGNSPAAS